MRTPKSLEKYLDKDQMKLYSLIWSRFVASQMTPAVIDTMRVDLEQNGVSYRSTGSKLKFDGFTKVYADSKHKDNMLPDLENGDEVIMSKNQPNQHFTLPPARFTEAALIKTLEENGVGRPSTYAPTLNTIQKRYYVKLAARKFEPTELGEIVDNMIGKCFPISSTSNLRLSWKISWMKLKKENRNGSKLLMNSTSLFQLKSRLLKKKWRKSK